MKFSLGLLILLLVHGNSHAQGGFSPSSTGLILVPVGTKVTFTTNFSWTFMSRNDAPVSISLKPGYTPDETTVTPSAFMLYPSQQKVSVEITVTFKSSQPACFYGPEGIVAYADTSYFPAGLFSCNGVWFDTSLAKRARAIPDTLNFGSVRIGQEDSVAFTIGFSPDTIAPFRHFVLQKIESPFFAANNISLQYCFDDLRYYAYFRPLAPGEFQTTAFYYDSVAHDSIPLILIGDAYDAGVADYASSPLKLFPNPCEGALHLLSTEPLQAIEIQDVVGHLVYSNTLMKSSSEDNLIDLSSLPAGVYFVRIRTASHTEFQRLIRE